MCTTASPEEQSSEENRPRRRSASFNGPFSPRLSLNLKAIVAQAGTEGRDGDNSFLRVESSPRVRFISFNEEVLSCSSAEEVDSGPGQDPERRDVELENGDKSVSLDKTVDASPSQKDSGGEVETHQALEPSFFFMPPVASERRPFFTTPTASSLASRQMSGELSWVKKTIRGESATLLLATQASLLEESADMGVFSNGEGVTGKGINREKAFFSLLHQRSGDQGGCRKGQDHSGGKKITNTLYTFLNLFKELFKTLGRLIVQFV